MASLEFKKGRVLYRTPSSATDNGIYGHYYSTREVAGYYSKKYNEHALNIYKFKTKKTMKLLDFSDIKSFEFLDSMLKGKIHEAFQIFTGYGIKTLNAHSKDEAEKLFCFYKNKPKYLPMICPEIPEFMLNEYGHKSLGKELCKLGFDGYFMPDKYVLPIKDSDYDITYHQEYFICDPKSSVEKVKELD